MGAGRGFDVRRIALGAGVAGMLIGGGHVVAWVTGLIPRIPVGTTLIMKTNAGLGIFLAGFALILLSRQPDDTGRRRIAMALAALVLLIGLATFSEHVAGWNLGIDEVLATELPGAAGTTSPNRMGPPASVSLALLATALLLLARPRRSGPRPALYQPFALAVTFLGLLAVIGYLYDASELYDIARYTAIAWPTALAFVLLGAGAMCVRPDEGLMARVTAHDAGGTMARALIGPILLLPLVLGWLRLTGERHRFFDAAMGTGLVMLLLIVTFLSLLVFASGRAAQASTGLQEREREARESAAAAHEANVRLEEADRKKDEFLAVLSHELRNPLAPVRAALHVLDRAAPGSDQATRATTVIGRQVTQLIRLVDDLLDVTRITRGKIDLRCERLDLAGLARRTAEDHRSLFAASGIDLDVDIPREPLWVDGDAHRLAQAIGNLLHNAAKFGGRGGRTAIRVGKDATANQAVITVADNGVGISPTALPQLFEPFMQVNQAIDRATGGLGLGLSLVKSLAEMHGGTVSAHSEGLGQGATFTIRLPLQKSPSVRPVAPAAVRSRPRRVLIIEDNADAAETLQVALELNDHDVEIAYDGVEGIAKARATRPDVVLCDIGLPGMDGYEVARTLRSDPAMETLHLVALTGYALPEDIAKARDAGFDLHVKKPPSPEQLEELLATLPPRAPSGQE